MAYSRIEVLTGAGSAAPASASARTARHIIVGQTGMGPTTPVVVDSLGAYQSLYGSRTAGAAMWDAAEFLLAQQAGPIVVQRATGPAATKATVALGTSAISVTAKLPGALSGWTAQYTTATKTVTLVKGAGATPVRYTGGTAVELEAAASVDPDVVVKVTTLPSADVAATALAGGSDDYANVVWASVLSQVPPGFGGSISAPGVAHTAVGAALAAWASANHALALLTSAAGADAATSVTNAVTAAGTVAALPGSEACVLVWPDVLVPTGVAQTKTVDAAVYFAACRMIAHRDFGPISVLNREVGKQVRVPVTAVYPLTVAQAQSLIAARVSFAEVLETGQLNPNNWVTVASTNPNLSGAQFRDIANCVAAGARVVLGAHIGQPATDLELRMIEGEIAGAVAAYGAYLAPQKDGQGRQINPGYTVAVSRGANPADGTCQADIRLRFPESIEMWRLTIAMLDANMTLV